MKRAILVLALIVGVALLAVPVTAQTPTPPTKVVLKGNPMGGVTFDHTAHVKAAGGDTKCDTCHHASKPEKAAKAKQEKCQTCHEKTATAPMKTNAKAAFHDPMAKKGTCVDCHVKEAAAGKKVPGSKCNECHNVKG
jgi:sRNA-binding protein